jgi:hypothetical protein
MNTALAYETRTESAHHARVTSNDSDAASVLDDLVRGGDLDAERVQDLIREAARQRMDRTQPTHNGKFVAIANDACALLLDLHRCINGLDFFGSDTGLVELQRTAQRIVPILAQMGYRRPQ